jgi:hypothetical protein
MTKLRLNLQVKFKQNLMLMYFNIGSKKKKVQWYQVGLNLFL